ncbi:MAG: PIN domain-containing protein [Bdellovibrionota bacterium]
MALYAADLSIEFELAMADSLILAFAKEAGVSLLTLDNDFAGIPNVVVVR